MNWTLVICCSVAVVATFLLHGSAAQGRVGLGGRCQNASQCNSTVPNTDCIASTCVCTNGYQNTTDNKACILKLNETCNATRVCNQTGASCKNNKCSCDSDYVISSNGRVCLKAAGVLGAYCSESRQCKIANAVCISTKCNCQAGYIENSAKECKIPSASDQCKSDNDCKSNKKCSAGYCRCEGSMSTGSCRTFVWRLGEKCDDKKQVCYQEFGEDKRSSCKKNKCTCNKGYVESRDRTQCINGASSLLASAALLLFAFVASRQAM